MRSRHSRKLFALAAALSWSIPAAVFAQVQVFGVGDMALTVQGTRNTGAAVGGGTAGTPANAGGDGSLVTASSGAWQASRLGVRAKVEITSGIFGVADFAQTLNFNNGLLLNATRLFDRNAYAGFSSETLGTLLFGRQVSCIAESLYATDPLRANNGATNMNVRLSYLAGPGTTLLSRFGVAPQNNINGSALDRQDNAVKYIYRGGGFVGMGMYSFSGVAANREKNSSGGGLLGFDTGPITLRVGGQFYNDSTPATFYAFTSGAVGAFGPVKVRATYSLNKVDNDVLYGNLQTNIWAAGVTLSALPQLDLTFAYYGAKRSQRATADQRADKLYFVPEWFVTKNFWVYGIADYEMFNAAGAALDTGTPLSARVTSSLFVALGVSYAFSL